MKFNVVAEEVESFAFEDAEIEPDVILISKAIGGSQPLSIVVYNKNLDLWQVGAHELFGEIN